MNRRVFLKLLLAAIASAPLSAYADVLDPQPTPPPTNTRQPQNTPEPQNENTPPNAATPAPQNSPTSPADSAPAVCNALIIGADIAGLRVLFRGERHPKKLPNPCTTDWRAAIFCQ